MGRLPARAIDADNHYFEPDDCFSRHIEPTFRERTIHVVPTDEPGVGRWALGDRLLRGSPHNFGDRCQEPGAMEDFFAGKVTLGMSRPYRPKDVPGMMRREDRYEVMDSQAIDAAIFLPTVGLQVEHDFQDDVEAVCANYRSFNRWIEEDWGYGADGRVFAVPMVTLLDVDFAVSETRRVVELGSRFVFLKTGPVAGRSPADPVFDRFWATVEETGVKVVFHADFSEFNDLYARHWSEDPNRNCFEWSPLQRYHSVLERPISDTMAALLLHNLFGRFPKVQIVALELGSGWIRPLLRQVDKAAKMAANGVWLGGKLDALPSEILPRHLHVAPFYEDDFRDAIELLGPERVLFGSDYPHPEGLGDPLSIRRYFDDLSDDEVSRIMYDNSATLLGLPSLAPAAT
jgi:predicted TIM-barrel fold metal-dependent hydrolase